MIRLKSLLIEQTADNAELPNVLFIGDSSIDEKRSFARIILDKKIVDGRIIARTGLTSKNFLRLAEKYIKPKYQSVVIAFGDIGLKEDAVDVIKNFQNIIDTATQSDIPVYVIYTNHAAIINRLKNDDKRENIKQIDKWVSTISKVEIIETDIKSINTPSENVHISKKLVKELGTEVNIDVAAAIDKIQSPADVTDVDTDKKPQSKKKFDKQKSANLNKTPNSKDATSATVAAATPVVSSSPVDISSTPLGSIDINDTVVNQSIELLKHFESYRSTAYWDVSNWRIGIGSSTITRKDGSVKKLSSNRRKQPTETITVEEALLDLNRRLKDEFIPWTLKAINNKQLPNNVMAALVSIVYNYGKLPRTVKKAVKRTPLSIQAIANAVAALSANPRRRKEEAAYILRSANSTPSNTPNNVNNQSAHVSSPGSAGSGYYVTSHYGPRWGKMHRGTDYRATSGTTIYIVKPGKVIFAGNRNPTGWGNMVEVEHEDGYTTRYAHMSRLDVSTGDDVPAGTMIGLSGGNAGDPGAGNSKGAHLHWELVPPGSTTGINGENVANTFFSLSKPPMIDIDKPGGNVDIFAKLSKLFK